MAIDFSGRRDKLRRQQAGSMRFVRVVVRVALLFVIAALAVLQGFSPTSWLLLGVLLTWGASLPYLLRTVPALGPETGASRALAAHDPDVDRGVHPDRRLRRFWPGTCCSRRRQADP